MIFIDASTLAELSSYGGLLQSITRWLERDDLAEMAPSFVRLAEARFNRLIRSRQRDAAVTRAADGSANLPTDYDGVKFVRVPGTTYNVVPQVSIDELASRSRGEHEPPVFAISGNTMLFDPPIDPAFPVRITYSAKIPPLSNARQSNWLLADHPDVYLFGALLQAEFYGWNDDRLGLIKGSVDETIAEINQQAVRQRFGASPLVMRTSFYEGR